MRQNLYSAHTTAAGGTKAEEGGIVDTAPRPCLLLHGFTGGPYEVAPLAAYLESRGRVCRVPTLPGHGDGLSGLGTVHHTEWLEAAAAEAQAMTEAEGSIDLVGFSMGGLISAYLVNRFPVRRLVLLNAAAIYMSPLRFAADAAERLRAGDWEHVTRARRTPLRAALQFMQLAALVKRQELRRIRVPTLIAQGRRDPVVHPRSARYIYRRLQGERELFYSDRAKHMICLEPDAPQLFAAVWRFLNPPVQ